MRDFVAENIRIAAFDLDGTTLENGVMSPGVKQALTQLREHHIAVVASTGRDISMLPKEALPFFQYRITANGSSVTDSTGKAISRHIMDKKAVFDGLRIIKSNGGKSCIYYNGFILASPAFLARVIARTQYASKSQRKGSKPPFKLALSINRWIKRKEHDVFKIQTFYKTRQDMDKAVEQLRNDGRYEVTALEELASETTINGISKAHGLLELCKELGCTADNTIAFGDSDNDMDILRTAGFAVVMGNGEEGVKKHADFITKSVSEDGVVHAIKTLFNY